MKIEIKKIIDFYLAEAELIRSKRTSEDEEEIDYTKNFRADMAELSSKKDIHQTSLGAVFGANWIRPRIKIFSLIYRPSNRLNNRQRKAIRYGLKSPLSCVIGPPGTGKSEMITGLVINEVLKGKKVLVASHNNKAVDEVAEKISKMDLPALFIRSGSLKIREENIQKFIKELPDSSDNFRYWKIIAPMFFYWPRFVLGFVRSRIRQNIFDIEKELKPFEIKYSRDYDEIEEKPGISTANYLRSCHAWGVTNLSIRTNFPLEPNLFDLLIIDEAAQCEVGPLIPLMYRAKRVMAVGDPDQLEPIVTLSKEERLSLMKSCELSQNESEIAKHSLNFFNLIRYKTGNKKVLLRDHYRCHPEIINFNNETFYSGKLKIKTNFDINDKNQGIFWINSRENNPTDNHMNRSEIELAKFAIKRVNERHGVEFKDIGIITPFRTQEIELSKAVSGISKEILCGTIHKFQGGERDTIIISLCLHPGMRTGTKKWVDEYKNMINVATSRAKKRLIVIGDYNEAMMQKAYVFDLAKYYESRIDKKVYNYK